MSCPDSTTQCYVMRYLCFDFATERVFRGKKSGHAIWCNPCLPRNAEGEIRTLTGVSPLRPEHSVSTSFTTSAAYTVCLINEEVIYFGNCLLSSWPSIARSLPF